jgi:hypothetical protein
VFSTQFMQKCYKQDKLEITVRESLGFSCELLLLEAGSWGREQFGNPEEGARPPLEAATKQRQWRRDFEH